MRALVEGLTPGRQRALFWLLACLDWDAAAHRQVVPPRDHAHPCRFLPLATAFYDRAIRDEGLLVGYSGYRWWRNGDTRWLWLSDRSWASLPWAADEVRAALAARDREAPGKIDSVACILELDPLADAWFVGMELRPLLAAPLAPRGTTGHPTARAEQLDQEVRNWLEKSWQRLTYDPAAQRCKLLPEGAPDDARQLHERGYPLPSVPFPGWEGPVPEVPGIIRYACQRLGPGVPELNC